MQDVFRRSAPRPAALESVWKGLAITAVLAVVWAARAFARSVR